LSLCALAVSCTFVLPARSAEERAAAGPDLLVKIHGSWAPRVERVIWPPDHAPALVSSEDGAERMAIWRTRCRELSHAAFDALRSASAGRLPATDFRASFFVVPNPDASRALILDPGRPGWSMADLRAGTLLPWPDGLQSRVVFPGVWSGDGRLLALRVDDNVNAESPTRLVVLDVPAGRIVYERGMANDKVTWSEEALAWSEDGQRIAILSCSIEKGDDLFDRLGAKIGHGPGYFADFELVIVDLANCYETRIPVDDHVRSGSGSVLWDERSVALMYP
jgi:hypothetical protein